MRTTSANILIAVKNCGLCAHVNVFLKVLREIFIYNKNDSSSTSSKCLSNGRLNGPPRVLSNGRVDGPPSVLSNVRVDGLG